MSRKRKQTRGRPRQAARTGDPRRVSGASIVGPGGPHDMDGVVCDATNAVLMDSVDVALIDVSPDDQGGDEPRSMAAFMVLSGRINQETDRVDVGFLMGLDAVGTLIAELLGLIARSRESDAVIGLVEAITEADRSGALPIDTLRTTLNAMAEIGMIVDGSGS